MATFFWISLAMALLGFSAMPRVVCRWISTPLLVPRPQHSSWLADPTVVRSSVVKKFFYEDPSIAAGLLRLHFHDCFVQGCDGSVLISGASAERSTLQNSGVRGFEVVDDAKFLLEAVCPGVVSCAGILALAARDSVDLTGGLSWSVPLGRRDGRISSASQAASLPSPADSVAVQRKKFADKGLNDHDLVTLVCAHTIGQTDCLFFRNRLQFHSNQKRRPNH